MSDKPIIMVCNIPEKPLRTPKASDKREYSPFFNPERRPPPPDPLEMGNHPELMEMLFEAYRAVEEYAFDKAEGLRETESNKELDDYTLYEDTLLKVLDSFKITDLIEEACDIDKLDAASSWNLLMLAKKHAIEDDNDLVGLITHGERDLKIELLYHVFLAWFEERWDGIQRWEKEQRRKMEEDHA